MEQTRVLVTGGCGFLGTAVVSALLATTRFDITAIDINPPSLGGSSFTDSVRYVRCNILDASALAKVFAEARPAIVVHTVGVYPLGARRYSMKGKEAVFQVNVEGTRNVLEAARGCGARGLVYTSSVTVVMDELERDWRNVGEEWPTGRAETSYGMSKTHAESLILSASTPSFPTCALRSSPIFGPNDPTCIPTIHSLIASHQTGLVLGTGTNLHDFVYISNIADAHVLAVGNLLNSGTAAGQAFFISNGEPVSARDFCIAVWKEFGHVPPWSVHVPERLGWWLGAASEVAAWLTGVEGPLNRGVVSEACRERYVCVGKARRVLGYEPRVGLEEGIRRSCAHYRKQLEGRAKR
ncbi:C-3 sterol dehydrogenase/C-4 decarboxylase-like protein [Pyrenochaeta sp. DS3sAY3a]|nr:C-3 sterol dehydrogenase/C-4 decarboxylase-like protein [Pyrenochaeta sp. DS3sAY3a]